MGLIKDTDYASIIKRTNSLYANNPTSNIKFHYNIDQEDILYVT